jgi:hypothetical protein
MGAKLGDGVRAETVILGALGIRFESKETYFSRQACRNKLDRFSLDFRFWVKPKKDDTKNR